MSEKLFNGVVAVFLPVKSLDRSIEWYSSIMGFELMFKDIERKAAGMSTGNEVWLNLVQVKNYKPVVFPENDFLTDIFFNYYTANFDYVYNNLKSKGIEVSEIIESFDFRCFSFKDIDGNNISVVSG